MYMRREYDARAVPRYLPVYNEVVYLDEQIDAIARGKHFARRRFDRHLEKAAEGFERIARQAETLSSRVTTERRNREMIEINFTKELEMTSKTQADINETQWKNR